jgi:hypothetical protein
MEKNKEDYIPLSELASRFKSYFRYLRTKLWWLVLAAFCGAGLGVTYFFIQKPKYEAVTTFIMEDKSPGTSGLAGLASQFGLNLGNIGSSGSLFTGDNILSILKSKKVIRQVLLSKVEDSNSNSKTLADVYLEFTGRKKKWQARPELAGINYQNAATALQPVQDSILNAIHEEIIKKHLLAERTVKQGTIIKVQITSTNSLFARLMTERLVNEASKLYFDIRTGTSQQSIDRLQQRSDSLLMLLNNKSYRAATSQLLDINPGIKSAVVPAEIASRDKTVAATLYAEVTKNLEASRMMLSQQTPVIQILDTPGELLDDHKLSLPFLMLVSTLIVLVISISIATVLYILQGTEIKNKVD